MFDKIKAVFSAERRAERDERRRANRAASAEYRNHLASDAHSGGIRATLGNRSGFGRQN